MSSTEEKLKQLSIILPEAPSPVGAYVASKKVSNLLFISGQLPISTDGKMIKGKIGKDLTLEDGFNEQTNSPDWFGYMRID